MANYYASAKTNSFQVNNVDDFENELEKFDDLEVISNKETSMVTIYSNSETGFVWDYFDEELDDYVEVDWQAIFQKHLADGWVAIIQEVGNEKLRYLGGLAVAFNNKGETIDININNIFELAKSIGKHVEH